MNYAKVHEALRKVHSPEDAESIIQGFNDLEVQNLDKLKDVFATKQDLYDTREMLLDKINESEKRLSDKIDNKIDDKINKVYWFLIGQTAALIMLFLAILRLVDAV
ncbi:MAG: hypothetical protein WBA23_14680 [Tunicatimonas sp.]|uniref:hypothetical protein n=1 Tax=Tunicatimonas sp. TaxID=1940096 RepID=UPI003C7607EE